MCVNKPIIQIPGEGSEEEADRLTWYQIVFGPLLLAYWLYSICAMIKLLKS